jgi:hypothetical protein
MFYLSQKVDLVSVDCAGCGYLGNSGVVENCFSVECCSVAILSFKLNVYPILTSPSLRLPNSANTFKS